MLRVCLQTHVFLVDDVDQRVEEEYAEENSDENGEGAASCSPVLRFSLVSEELRCGEEVELDQQVPECSDCTHEQYYYHHYYHNFALIDSFSITCMLQHSKATKLIERTLLKSVLPVLALNNEWSKWTVILGRISAICFEKRQTKEKKPKCIVCDRQYDNYLLLLLHLQLVHKDRIEVTSYEFHDETMVISTKHRQQTSKTSSYFSKDNAGECLLGSLKERSRQILTGLFSKCSMKAKSEKREYFHSVDIFRPLHADSEDEDSDGDMGKVQQQLQRMRISDFTDVNQNDKLFFIKWNEAVHHSKKANVYLNDDNIRELLQRFAKTAKKENLKRASLVMHAWTLWSAGRIVSQDVHFFLNAYDKANP